MRLQHAREVTLTIAGPVAVPGGVLEKGTKTGRARRIALGPTTATSRYRHLAEATDRAGAIALETSAPALGDPLTP